MAEWDRLYVRVELTDVYNACMKSLNDVEYCAGVVEAVVDAASRWIYTYVSERRAKPRFHIIRTHRDYVVKIFVDLKKESLILMLEGLGHSLHLFYKREDRKLVLKNGEIVCLETLALKNEYLEVPLGALIGIIGTVAGVIPTLKGYLTDVYNSCMRTIGDTAYCSGVVEAVIDAGSKWIYTCMPEGRTKPRIHIIRTHNEYKIDVYADKNKEGIVVVLDGRGHSIQLFYKREGDKFVLRRGAIHNLGTIAMMNGHFEPPLDAVKSRGGGS